MSGMIGAGAMMVATGMGATAGGLYALNMPTSTVTNQKPMTMMQIGLYSAIGATAATFVAGMALNLAQGATGVPLL